MASHVRYQWAVFEHARHSLTAVLKCGDNAAGRKGPVMALKTRTACAALVAGMAFSLCLSARPARASYIVTLEQVGSDVVATGSGAIDLTGLTLAFSDGTNKAKLTPSEASITTGPAADTPTDGYDGFSGPVNFGGGGITIDADSGSGNLVTIVGGGNLLGVPHDYVSGSALSDTSTYDGATFAGLGVTPGRYEWTWGSGVNQNFTLIIGTPEPSTLAMMLVGFAGLGFAGYRKIAQEGRLRLGGAGALTVTCDGGRLLAAIRSS
jgi:PEP-CTERM motif